MSDQNYFDQRAQHWDADPRRLERARRGAELFSRHLPAGGHWMEYGCGTGLLGLALVGHADRVTLVDSSAGMCQRARENAQAAGLLDRVEVVQADLLATTQEEPHESKIQDEAHDRTANDSADEASAKDTETSKLPAGSLDAIISLMVFHHIHDTEGVLRAMFDLLTPGGHVAISDLDEEGGHFHHGHGIEAAHNGFDRGGLIALLESIGFSEATATDGMRLTNRGGHDFGTFLVTARKPGN